jgi:hypothetical protein
LRNVKRSFSGSELRLLHVLQALIYVAIVILARRNSMPMMVLLGGIGHFVLISACLAALFDRRIDDETPWKMVAGGVSVLAYFALSRAAGDRICGHAL